MERFICKDVPQNMRVGAMVGDGTMSLRVSHALRDVWSWKRRARRHLKGANGELELSKSNSKARSSISCAYRLNLANIYRFAAALGRMGIRAIEAFTDPEIPTCFSLYHRRTVDFSGRRFSTYRGFLPKQLVLQRKNLTICLGAHGQRILFSDTENLKAIGILVEGENEQIFIVKANHEIILSAGAIATPQLLLLRQVAQKTQLLTVSGVGPKDHLADVGIPCIHDLPGVGSTLVIFPPCLRNFLIKLARSRSCFSQFPHPLTRLHALLASESYRCDHQFNTILSIWHRFPFEHRL